MNLIVDIGNTSTKLAVYKGTERIFDFRMSDFSCEEMERELWGFKIRRGIVSSVKMLPSYINDLLSANIPDLHFLSHKSKVPFKIEYETPETLGPDRIAAVAAVYNSFKGLNALIIDAGSAITFDYLYKDVYKGGNISPGMEMRLKALNKFTDKLPLVDKSAKFTAPGRNTNDAILAGVITGITYEINEYIRTFKKEDKNSKVIITGGDSGFLGERIHHEIVYMPDAVIDGLNNILVYNA